MNEALSNIPEVSFIDNMTVTDVQEQMIADYQTKYEELTGKPMELARASPYRMILYSCSLQIYQILMYLDSMGKQNLLKYAQGSFLEQIAALRGIHRMQGSRSLTTIRFAVESERTAVTAVPEGTRVAAGDIYFATTEYAEVAAGKLYVDVPAECTEIGVAANDLMPGEINSIIDSAPFIASAVNLTTSNSGTDVESDDDFAERIYLAPAGYSVAGPEDAYAYFVKECNSGVSDVSVSSDNPTEVDVRFIMKNGQLPSAEMLAEVDEYLSSKTRRPLTDKVTISAPEVSAYDISVKYWISSESKSVANSIQKAVADAVDEYKAWQDSKIGRDINPSELTYKLIKAGAKRVEVASPQYTRLSDKTIAQNQTLTLEYGGIEDD